MESDSDYKNGFPKIDANKDSVLSMLSKVAAFKMEERDLALDRFKRCNEDMDDEAFFIQGKTAIMYLDSASKASNYLGDIAKDMMKLVFEAPSESGQQASLNDKESISQLAASMIRDRRRNVEEPKRLNGSDMDKESYA